MCRHKRIVFLPYKPVYLSPQPFFINIRQLAQTKIVADERKVSDKPESKYRKLSEPGKVLDELSHTKHVQKQGVYCNDRYVEAKKTQ